MQYSPRFEQKNRDHHHLIAGHHFSTWDAPLLSVLRKLRHDALFLRAVDRAFWNKRYGRAV
jgi:hypothetical protein